MISKLKIIGRQMGGLLIALIFTLPLFWAVVASLGELGQPVISIEWWPELAHWENYVEIFRRLPLVRYMLNSLFVVGVAVPVTLLTASLAGFGISQLPAPLQRRLLLLSAILLVIPDASVWLFRFQIYRWTGLLDTLWALIAPALAGGNPLFVLLFFWAFRRVPLELYEAARLEGASALIIWWRIALPLARPTILAVTILSFVIFWSDFVSPILYIFDPDSYTLPVGLQLLKQLHPAEWPLLMAGAILMTSPVLILFIFIQRRVLPQVSFGAKIIDS